MGGGSARWRRGGGEGGGEQVCRAWARRRRRRGGSGRGQGCQRVGRSRGRRGARRRLSTAARLPRWTVGDLDRAGAPVRAPNGAGPVPADHLDAGRASQPQRPRRGRQQAEGPLGSRSGRCRNWPRRSRARPEHPTGPVPGREATPQQHGPHARRRQPAACRRPAPPRVCAPAAARCGDTGVRPGTCSANVRRAGGAQNSRRPQRPRARGAWQRAKRRARANGATGRPTGARAVSSTAGRPPTRHPGVAGERET